MNTPFPTRLYSVLLIGALLPFGFSLFSQSVPNPFSAQSIQSLQSAQSAPFSLSSDPQILAFGSGIPEARGGGGTR